MVSTYSPTAGTYRDRSGTYRVGYGGERSYVDQAPRVASDSQVRYLCDLFARMSQIRPDVFEAHFDRFQRTAGIPGEWNDGEPNPPRTMTATVASKAIDWALKITGPLPKTTVRFDFRSIPDGNYALGSDTVGDPIKFYRVTTKGKWKNVQVRASDSLYAVRGAAGLVVLRKIIEAGLDASQMLFAAKLERCWKCGHSLTDELSRSRGQGPDCWEK